MIAFSGLRPAIVVSQVVLTFGAAQLAGVAAAAHYQGDQVGAAQAAIAAADHRFDERARLAVADGTPPTAVDPVVAQHHRVQARAIPSSNFFIDRVRIDALRKRAADTDLLTRQVAAAETQVEVGLHQELVDAVKGLRDLVDPARAAGVDPTEYATYADTVERDNSQLSIPRVAEQRIAEVRARGVALKQATADKIAADETARQAALAHQAARDLAQANLNAAQQALARAKAIPVLTVADNEKAIADYAAALGQKLAADAPTADFLSLAASIRDQTDFLNGLVNTRQAAYDLLSAARREAQLATAAKVDVSAAIAQLDAAGPRLDAAGDLGTLQSVMGQIKAAKNDIEAKYLGAIYGVGKVIVVSVSQERLVALQDGVIVLSTLVTTGRPSLPTVLGTFHIFFKSSPYHMCTPPQWKGTQYDYGCVDERWAMEFESSGYFIHDAPWRSHYGPGSDTEYGGTHGCVNVPNTQMAWLYDWAPVGTTVVTKTGDLPG
jgi:lipoprotein-anchoring transpeptidase ErfK/SrfK